MNIKRFRAYLQKEIDHYNRTHSREVMRDILTSVITFEYLLRDYEDLDLEDLKWYLDVQKWLLVEAVKEVSKK